MDGQRSRSGQGKERKNGVNHFRGQYKQRSRNYRRGTHQNGNNFTESRGRNSTPYTPRMQPVQEASTSSSCVDSDTKGNYTQTCFPSNITFQKKFGVGLPCPPPPPPEVFVPPFSPVALPLPSGSAFPLIKARLHYIQILAIAQIKQTPILFLSVLGLPI